MTIKQTLAHLRGMGLKASWSSEWREYRITHPGPSWEVEEDMAYYTSDSEDALHTGAAMVRVIIDPKAAAQDRIGNIWDAQDKQEAY
jgi:hypothetical protein